MALVQHKFKIKLIKSSKIIVKHFKCLKVWLSNLKIVNGLNIFIKNIWLCASAICYDNKSIWMIKRCQVEQDKNK